MAITEKRAFQVYCEICGKKEYNVVDTPIDIDSRGQIRQMMAWQILPKNWEILYYRGEGAKTLCVVCAEKEWKENRAALERKPV